MLESLMLGTMRRRRRSIAMRQPVGWFIAGAAAGGAGALLYVSYSDRDLPKQLRSATQNWRERARHSLSRAVDRARSARRGAARQGAEGRDLRPSTVGEDVREVLSGDLPGSVGGLSAGALGDSSSRTEEKPQR